MAGNGGRVSEEQIQARSTSIERFIESLRNNKSFESMRDVIRVMPKGLFVDEQGIDQLVAIFQGWIHAVAQGAADKSQEKTKHWLLDGLEPERFYLVEGKHVRAGYLIPLQIQTPQKYGLPYYLGSLLPTSDYLHPADPKLRELPRVEVRHTASGLEAVIQRRGQQVVIPEATIRSFRDIARGSRFLQRRYPGCNTTLLVSLSTLANLIARARIVPRTFPICVPHSDARHAKGRELRVAGKFLFIEDRGVVMRVLEQHGKHLSDFLRSELSRAPRDKLGSCRLTPKHRDLLGFYDVGGRRTSIHARAFAEFTELIRRSREPRERFSGWFTALDSFQAFSSIFQSAQPIDKRKIAATLERFEVQGHSFRICGGWIFVLSRENSVLRTLARHIRLPGNKRVKE
jgi:hypothetical protein